MKNSSSTQQNQKLPQIESPRDLKELPLSSLEDLCQEIRDYIIEVMSINGGHLATNLGAVEISVAMHYIFNSPQDKILFDTGHQSYTHKILTGRYKEFPSIRKYKGLCGFTNPDESKHDHFHAGHAGTALSLALGTAKERDLLNRQEKVIALMGDAALTCGLTLEALNNVPKDLKDFVIILNDNAMAISENVGAITHILSRLLNNPQSNRIYKSLDAMVSRIPHVGKALAQQGNKLTESLKNLVSPAAFFQQYGLSYVGPIDGHDIKRLCQTFEAIREERHPTIVHVLTNKGQGMANAVAQPTPYHGAKPFDIKTGEFHPSKSTSLSFPKVFGKHLCEMMEKDQNLVVVNPAMTAGSCIEESVERFPTRTLDVGIAEGHCVSYAGALAKRKELNVVCSIYSTFLQRAVDNVYHDVCLQESPVVFCVDRAGIATGDGVTHHGIYDIGFLKCMPNIVLSQPRDGKVLKELLSSSFNWKRPSVIRYPNISCRMPEGELETRKPGKAELLRKGKELLIIGLGHMAYHALDVADKLQKEYGIEASVLDPVFVKPLDQEMLVELLLDHKRIITIEEHDVATGLGNIISHFLVSNGYYDIPTLHFGLPESFFHQGSYQTIMDDMGLSIEKIIRRIETEFSLNKMATL
ncbi:MAG: 1-deoxy-D-xylulose-5-phosphate synthase [Chlamydiales bacterium]|nr:1-deoxy-D-xylulose-5-phosphate synthase [Chlamydiales bacterium]NCF70515.1 1-deoxy-D-xylulose-5-phosphate synthase [Chlamydiales bacterium]